LIAVCGVTLTVGTQNSRALQQQVAALEQSFSDRFNAAVLQLGDSNPVVRMAAVSSLASLADWASIPDVSGNQIDYHNEHRDTVINVLVSYLRAPVQSGGAGYQGELAVRETIMS